MAEKLNRERLWRTFVRRERWRLSARGWFIVFAIVCLTLFILWSSVYPFLAVTHRVNAKVLIVEGWIHDYAIRAAVQEFGNNGYQLAISTGGPIEGTGEYINDYNTSASVGADRLKKAGLPDSVVLMVPSHVMDRDRTYSSALALKTWLRNHKMSVHGVNIVTEALHARRSRFLYQKALGAEMSVGVIAVPTPDYDAKYWWRYSEGVKDVIDETVSYLYATVFFHPPNEKDARHSKKEGP